MNTLSLTHSYTRPDVTTFVISFECVHTHTHSQALAIPTTTYLTHWKIVCVRARGIAIGFIGMKRAAAAATA